MWIAALDIGGSKLAATIASASGPLSRVVQATVKQGPSDALARQCLYLLQAACEPLGVALSDIQQVGVSSAGPFEICDGLLTILPPNICGAGTESDDLPNDWTRIPLEAVLREQFKTVRIVNDCVAALHGERHFGAAQHSEQVIYVTWSTGIGFGLCVDGHILQGKSGNAGHAGHMLMSELSDALCGCGNRGDLEGLVAGRNLGNRNHQALSELFAAAKRGEALALKAVGEAATWFGRGLYNLTTTLDTQLILVGGSVWRENQSLLQPLVQAEISSRFAPLTRGVQVQSAALGEWVTDIGALSLVMPAAWISEWRTQQPWAALQ